MNELVLSSQYSLQIYLLHLYFVFFSPRSPAMWLKKAFIRAQNLKFSLEFDSSRRVRLLKERHSNYPSNFFRISGIFLV